MSVLEQTARFRMLECRSETEMHLEFDESSGVALQDSNGSMQQPKLFHVASGDTSHNEMIMARKLLSKLLMNW